MSAEIETVDAEVVEPLSENAANALDKRIRTMVGSISNSMDTLAALIAEAKAGQIYVAMGKSSWTAYLADVVQAHWQDRTDRRKIVALLSGEGMSQRAIASATGVSQKTVDRDLDQVSQDDSTDNVVGLDGKRYRREREQVARRKKLAEQIIEETSSEGGLLAAAKAEIGCGSDSLESEPKPKADAKPKHPLLDALSYITDATIKLHAASDALIGVELTDADIDQLCERFDKHQRVADLLGKSFVAGSFDDELRKLLDDDA